VDTKFHLVVDTKFHLVVDTKFHLVVDSRLLRGVDTRITAVDQFPSRILVPDDLGKNQSAG